MLVSSTHGFRVESVASDNLLYDYILNDTEGERVRVSFSCVCSGRGRFSVFIVDSGRVLFAEVSDPDLAALDDAARESYNRLGGEDKEFLFTVKGEPFAAPVGPVHLRLYAHGDPVLAGRNWVFQLEVVA